MKKWLFFLGIIITSATRAQFTVRLIVTGVATRANEDIYVSGNFNNWNPKDENYKLKPFGGARKSLVIKNMAAGTYAFKFTRGSNNSLETTSDGRDISDRVLEVNEDVSQEFAIAGWKDDYPDVPKKYTASPQVRIMDTAFAIPQLNRKRKIWVYLPRGYAASSKTYPVLYMQDGQELFNDQTATKGEWGVDECLDTLQLRTGKECIVVGIDNGGDKRASEYDPYGEGGAYLGFIANTLKPFIDTKYRTKKSVENTFIAGSDMGGLISVYALLAYPNVFGAAAGFSPSFAAAAPRFFTDAQQFATTLSPRLYLYAGKMEAGTVTADNDSLAGMLKKNPRYSIRLVTDPLGRHEVKSWKGDFASFYVWLMNY